MEERQIVSGELYRHFKGMLYQIIGVAKHSETMESMVVYQALYGDYGMYVRPLSMFLSEVDHEKYPEVTQKYRFTKIDRATLEANKPEYQQSNTQQKQAMTSAAFKQEQNMFEDMHEVVNGDVHPEAHLVNEDLMAFLDAKDYSEKLEILYTIRKRIDDRVLSDIEMSLDMPISKLSIDERINLVKDNLQALAKFECSRLR
ncbi:MAG: DUF1653 domain-containing protein [Clostridiales bacterium]|nr:DUF1653 domain-containing protein [Clostridiales bacterium]